MQFHFHGVEIQIDAATMNIKGFPQIMEVTSQNIQYASLDDLVPTEKANWVLPVLRVSTTQNPVDHVLLR